MENRKGARRMQDIPQSVLEVLNQGLLPTVNLVEWLAIDQKQVLQSVLPLAYHAPLLKAIEQSKNQSALTLIKLIGAELAQMEQSEELFTFLKQHKADIPRCWAAIMVGQTPSSLDLMLQNIAPFAADEHFGVREIAWLSVRPSILEHPQQAFQILLPWTLSEDPYIRRFTSEATRPKGVWCKQFEWIQKKPTTALPLLDNLQADPSKYVQDSVANWLNDLSKTNPAFVQDVCKQWKENNPKSKATTYIIRRALRSLK